jgi:hypothetical protein
LLSHALGLSSCSFAWAKKQAFATTGGSLGGSVEGKSPNALQIAARPEIFASSLGIQRHRSKMALMQPDLSYGGSCDGLRSDDQAPGILHCQFRTAPFRKRVFRIAYERNRRNYPMQAMKWVIATVLAAAFFYTPNVLAQQPSSDIHPATTESQETNLRAYIELLRVDVRTKKTAIFTEIMQFNEQQAAKFWPIYTEYDSELQKLNDQKLAGIQEYAKNFGNMTDEKADELAMLALDLENKRNDLKKTYYEKVREQLGGIIAARFLQIENQLLMVIDLQIAASLPIVQ